MASDHSGSAPADLTTLEPPSAGYGFCLAPSPIRSLGKIEGNPITLVLQRRMAMDADLSDPAPGTCRRRSLARNQRHSL